MTDIHTVRTWLTDIAQWRPLLTDAAATILGVSSPRLTWTTSSGAGDASNLPFHLDRAIDHTDQGATGIRTEHGLDEIMTGWARQIAASKHDPQPRNGLAYLQQDGVLEWAHDHDDWDALTETIQDAHQTLARITGHAPIIVGACPHCGGHITTDPTQDGIPDHGECDTCGRWYQDHDDINRTRRDTLRSVAIDPDLTVTTSAALRIWPELDRRTIHDWRDAGKLSDPLNLRTLNTLANTLVDKRSRHAEPPNKTTRDAG